MWLVRIWESFPRFTAEFWQNLGIIFIFQTQWHMGKWMFTDRTLLPLRSFNTCSLWGTALNPNLPSRNSEKFGCHALKLYPVWASKKLQLIWEYQIFRLWVSISMSWNCRELRFMITHHRSVGYWTGKHLRWDVSKPGQIFYTQESFHLDHLQNSILNMLLLSKCSKYCIFSSPPQ